MQSLRSWRKQMAWLFAVALAVPSYAAAQSLGVQGGVGFSTFKTEDSDASLDSVVAPAGGLYLVFGSNSLTGRADVIYAVRGAKSEFGTYRLTYLEIPLGAQFQFARTSHSDVHVFGGTSIGIKLDAKLTQPDDVDVALDNEVEDFDLGIFVGAGVTIGRFVIDGRYTHGVRNINVDADTPDVKNRSFAIMFVMRLK
jgi:outer membrane protein with beta-barrel domain